MAEHVGVEFGFEGDEFGADGLGGEVADGDRGEGFEGPRFCTVDGFAAVAGTFGDGAEVVGGPRGEARNAA